MPQDFGSLLRYYRKDKNDLTQEALAEELKLELGTDVEYSKTDISKWEKGKRVPVEYVVEALDKILSANGVLIKAVGCTVQISEAQKFDQSDLPHLQMEHVARLQDLARSMASDVFKVLDDIKNMNMQQFEESGSGALFGAFQGILLHSLWPCLRGHLEQFATEIEAAFPDKLGSYIFARELGNAPYTDEATYEVFKASLIQDITNRIVPLNDFGICGTVSGFGERFSPRCPYCPAQKAR
jgi:transcriptional regulator with XRE-family HTH domain